MANIISIFNIMQTTLLLAVLLYLMRETIIETVKKFYKGTNVAELKLRGPIKESKDSMFEEAISSEDVVKFLRNFKEEKYDALIVNINTPGGSPVPSNDIKTELENLNIPVYTYTRSLCASGGYMIACGTDHIHARQDSLVGSIGVIGNQHKASGLADKLGIEYERFTGGKHKDTHRPFKELSEEERDYWQSVIDASYENFVETVSNSRNISEEKVRQTNAEIYNAEQAEDKNLVDSVGSRRNLKQQLRQELNLDEVKISQKIGGSLSLGRVDALFSNMAYSFGKGISSAFNQNQDTKIEYRI